MKRGQEAKAILGAYVLVCRPSWRPAHVSRAV